jgi:hypothetical protein
MAMRRTTIMAEDELLDGLRSIARAEGLSLAEVIRQGLEWRLNTRRRVPSFLGKLKSDHGPTDTAQRAEELIAEYARKKYAPR